MKEDNYCKGCRTYQVSILFCPYSKDNAYGQCPCTNCIIKVMCHNEYNDYTWWKKTIRINK